MTTRKTTTHDLRECKGSARFGIEPHEAPISEFPKQPSRKDGLGVMCTEHWRAYVNALRKAAAARQAEAEVAPAPQPVVKPEGAPEPEGQAADDVSEPEAPAPRTAQRSRTKAEPTDEADAA